MTDKEAREVASSRVSRKKHKIPEAIEFATLDDIDDLEEELIVVPLKKKSGGVSNWLVRKLTGGEKAVISRTMFSKTAINAILVGGEIDSEKALNFDPDKGYVADLLTIKQATVFPENLTLEDIGRLSAEHIDEILDRLGEEDTDAKDVVNTFSEDGSGPEQGSALSKPQN